MDQWSGQYQTCRVSNESLHRLLTRKPTDADAPCFIYCSQRYLTLASRVCVPLNVALLVHLVISAVPPLPASLTLALRLSCCCDVRARVCVCFREIFLPVVYVSLVASLRSVTCSLVVVLFLNLDVPSGERADRQHQTESNLD